MQPGTAVQDKPTTTPSLPLENGQDLWTLLSLDPTQHQSTTSSPSSSSSSSPVTTSTMSMLQPAAMSPITPRTAATTHP